jgi:pimeloyl-ACP methyl ester carboxylesterase
MNDTTTAPTHSVELADGRTVTVDERGPADGPAVVLLHAAPGSRRFDPDPAATAKAGVRLVTIDRAGYGGSTPLPTGEAPSIPQAADDTAEALAALGIGDAAVVGWSGGGRVALALAARHPALVRSVGVVGTPAPDDEVPWVPDEHRPMIEQLRPDPGSATAQLTEVFAPMVLDPAATTGFVSGGDADDEVLADEGRREALVAMLAEAFAQGAVGMAADIVADQIVPWGFDVASVGAPVSLFYGELDAGVSSAHGEWYDERLAASTLTVVPGAGHLLVMTQWDEILTAVTANRGREREA